MAPDAASASGAKTNAAQIVATVIRKYAKSRSRGPGAGCIRSLIFSCLFICGSSRLTSMSHYLQLALNCIDFSQFYIPIAAHGGTVNECRSLPPADGNVLADDNGMQINPYRHLTELVSDIRGNRGRLPHSLLSCPTSSPLEMVG